MALPSNDKFPGLPGHTEDHNAIVDEIIYVKQNYYSASSIGVNLPEYLRRDSASVIYAPKGSASFIGTPTAPTASPTTNTQQIATTAFVRTEITNLIASAPSTLDTLNELAAALGNDANFATSTASAIGQRLLASTASTLYLGINNTANHARTASSIAGLLVAGPVASANFALFANSASSINWSLVTNRPSASPALNPQIGINLVGSVTGAASATLTQLGNAQITITTSGGSGGGSASVDWINVINKPDPIIGINLIGNTTGAASATLIDLTNGQISITTNTSFANSASSISGLLVTGPVASANFALFANSASSIAGSLVTGTVNNANHANTASSINSSLITGTTLPSSIVNSSLTSVGTLTALTVSQSSGKVQLNADAGGSISLGRTDDVASTPYIDFNSSASSVDFDVRIQVSGGDGIGSGRGTLAISASVVNIDSGTLVVDGTRNRVGIGTTAPNTALEVVSSNSNITARSTGESHQSTVAATDVNYFAGPTFRGTYITQFGASATGTLAGISTTSLGALAFQNANNALIYTNGGTPIIFATLSLERMRITGGGNIGIGTTNPNRTLSVVGSASFTGDISAPTFSGLLLGNAQTASSINGSLITGSIDGGTP